MTTALERHVAWLRGCMRDNGMCVDGAKCHHDCNTGGPCFRADSCVPLSGSELADDWKLPAPTPIDMVLHCPKCHMQHIDAPEPAGEYTARGYDPLGAAALAWTNPPHKSHLCHGCGHIWRPADVPTNGVVAVKTRGKHDSQ